MAGLDRNYTTGNPVITNDSDAQGNFDRLTVLQDVAQSISLPKRILLKNSCLWMVIRRSSPRLTKSSVCTGLTVFLLKMFLP